MPEQPIPEQDPIVTRSYAPHYVIAMVILMATLFWALWDEAFGQRPWITYQREWKKRYSAFLKSAELDSKKQESTVERDPEYQGLKQAYAQAQEQAKPRIREIQQKLSELGPRLQRVQDVFTDRRAKVNALTYEMETDSSLSARKRTQEDIDEFKQERVAVKFHDGHREQYNFDELQKKYNELRDERTRLNTELGEVLKPVSEANIKLAEYFAGHMVDLRPEQIEGLSRKTAELDPKIQQINVADANIVDR